MKYLLAVVFACISHASMAAPDEESLGKADSYPVAPSLAHAFTEAYRVGSFSAMDSLAPHCALQPSDKPQALPKADIEPTYQYRFDNQVFSLDDYMQRHRVTSLLVLKDGKIMAERSNYGRRPEQRLLSNSMAKTIVALGIGKALEEGLIKSLDDTAATYEPKLANTQYGETKIINLLRMASGVKFTENYSGKDDLARFTQAMRTLGSTAAAKVITERQAAEGTQFNYSSAETQILGLVLRGATGTSLCKYIGEKIWQPMGAESRATWITNQVDQTERANGYFNATVHDYARLGMLLANDGQRDGKSIISRDYLLQMTDADKQPQIFKPGSMQNKGSTYYGYGFQTWLLPGSHRRFVMLGIYGQAIFVDPELKLVVVHMAAAKDASGDASGTRMVYERTAMFRGIVSVYGKW
jgi:CubicO group peptidase (beta-lactamase class C family)